MRNVIKTQHSLWDQIENKSLALNEAYTHINVGIIL